MGYIIKECTETSFDVLTKDGFMQNVIVYNLYEQQGNFACILEELNEIGTGLTQTEFKELDKFTLKLGFDDIVQDNEFQKIHDAIYQRIYSDFKKGKYDDFRF